MHRWDLLGLSTAKPHPQMEGISESLVWMLSTLYPAPCLQRLGQLQLRSQKQQILLTMVPPCFKAPMKLWASHTSSFLSGGAAKVNYLTFAKHLDTEVKSTPGKQDSVEAACRGCLQSRTSHPAASPRKVSWSRNCSLYGNCICSGRCRSSLQGSCSALGCLYGINYILTLSSW